MDKLLDLTGKLRSSKDPTVSIMRFLHSFSAVHCDDTEALRRQSAMTIIDKLKC